jgi:membrane protein DedA with SNARE-associated domain
MDQIQPYLDYFAANPDWAIAVIFLIAFGEALLIIGLFVPSTVVLVGAGMLVGTGHLGFWEVFIATTLGAVLGDQVSYWAGRFYGTKLKTMWPLSRYPVLVNKGEDFVKKHGGKSIAIGRFIPGVKAVVPGIVGMLGMSQLFFLIVNVVSGIVWGLAHVGPGILLGQGLALAGDLSGHLVVVLLVLFVLVGFGGWLIRILAGILQPYTNAVLRRISIWARSSKNRAWNRFGKAIQPGNPRAPAVILLFLIAVASLIFLADIVTGFVLRDAASNLDLSVATLMGELRNAPADAFMIPLTMVAERPVIWAMGLAIALWLFLWRAWRLAMLLVSGMSAAGLSAMLLNHYFSTELSNSFISVPTLMAGMIFGTLAALASHAMGRWSKAAVAAICGSIVVAIAFSRVYLGAELLSGVLAAALIALILTSLFGMLAEAIPSRRIKPYGLMAYATAVLLLVGGYHLTQHADEAELRYAAKPTTQTFTAQEWAAGQWGKIANRRIDLAGTPEEVFKAQWIGDLRSLETAFEQQGWKRQATWHWLDTIQYLDPQAGLDKLPPRPVLHKGLKAKLTMTLNSPGGDQRRLVLRAFKAQVNVDFDGDKQPVYLLSITPEIPRARMKLWSTPSTQKNTAEDDVLAQAAITRIKDITVIAETTDPLQPAKVLLAKP